VGDVEVDLPNLTDFTSLSPPAGVAAVPVAFPPNFQLLELLDGAPGSSPTCTSRLSLPPDYCGAQRGERRGAAGPEPRFGQHFRGEN
jgi:hypothetical protein